MGVFKRQHGESADLLTNNGKSVSAMLVGTPSSVGNWAQS